MKKNANENVSLTEAAETFNQLATTGEAGVTYDQAFEMLKSAPDTALQSLGSEYFTFDKVGQVEHFVYEGNSEFTKNGKVIPVVKLRTESGESVINGDKVLYSACQRLETVPSYIRVTYSGDVNNAAGTYKKLDVRTFSPVKS